MQSKRKKKKKIAVFTAVGNVLGLFTVTKWILFKTGRDKRLENQTSDESS